MQIFNCNALVQEDQLADSHFAGGSDFHSSIEASTLLQLKRREWVLIWIFWGCIASLRFLNALVNGTPSSLPQLPLLAPLTGALIESLVWALLTPLIFGLTTRYSLDRSNWLSSLILLLALGFGISLLMATFMTYVGTAQVKWFLHTSAPVSTPMAQTDTVLLARRFWFMNEFLIYLIALASGFARDYLSRYRTRNEQAAALLAQAAHMRAELSDARLDALRSQLNPHFLFNTLNSISVLVNRDPNKARQMISCLSDLLRDTLEGSELEVPLEQELVLIRRYIDIMHVRFHGQLIVNEGIDSDTLNARVPKLILQPLVENAIKHGIAKLDGIGNIGIFSHRSHDMLVLDIKDNGALQPKARVSDERDGFGIGLRNTQARLQQSYGDKQSLTLSSHAEGGVVATITLPFHTENRTVNLQ